ncbi:hypothetical protein [Sinorhizobium meliloti]|uniref:hypothetical protein n=1 Tax=Rhizobium meliloti TaxID=382 RepID=UPI00028618FE|nr:hypothetical protein [Sinorhizobium meliloti]ASP83062.1 hypothetical protein CDO27_35265 [Sinorhizobium meliloti]MQW20036.1 hypothetical protein [Sinorhizobium meliloti]CCM69579.1 hypothetical protein BN406_06642 [Sinorhizobium meliloti Rm41]
MGMRPQFAPDATQLKDVLRGMRHALRCGRDVLQKTVPANLPQPASRIARSALLELDEFGRNVDQVVSKAAHTVFGDPKPRSYSLQAMIAYSAGAEEFSLAFYETMKASLTGLHASRALVSQNAARKAFTQITPHGEAERFAAALLLQLLEEESVRIDCLDASSPVPRNSVAKVANFAVLLYLLADNHDRIRQDMILSATDLAITLQDEIAKVCLSKDRTALSLLFARYSAHV